MGRLRHLGGGRALHGAVLVVALALAAAGVAVAVDRGGHNRKPPVVSAPMTSTSTAPAPDAPESSPENNGGGQQARTTATTTGGMRPRQAGQNAAADSDSPKPALRPPYRMRLVESGPHRVIGVTVGERSGPRPSDWTVVSGREPPHVRWENASGTSQSTTATFSATDAGLHGVERPTEVCGPTPPDVAWDRAPLFVPAHLRTGETFAGIATARRRAVNGENVSHDLTWRMKVVGTRAAVVSGITVEVWEIERRYVSRSEPDQPSAWHASTIETVTNDWYSPDLGITIRSVGTKRETEDPTREMNLTCELAIHDLEA